ncbi:MAG: D-alanine--D-alanine ligase family protein [Bacillota bacterium]
MGEKLRVGVLFGGRSGEHEVSLMSAASVISALDREKYDRVLVGIDKQGRWHLLPPLPGQVNPVMLAEALARAPVVVLAGDPQQPSLFAIPARGAGTVVERLDFLTQKVDVVFPVLHGPYGEDGTVQGLLELAGIPYVGAGVLASSLGMDKALMKVVFSAHGLPVTPFRVVLRSRWEGARDDAALELEVALGYPCFVKPANLGSSVGVERCLTREQLLRAMDNAARYDRKLVVEKGVRCRELECSVLGNDEPLASVVGEIVPAREFYDYASKYLDPRTRLVIPAPVPEEVSRQVQDLAIHAFRAIDCAGLARVDFFWDQDTGQVLVNEINTIPGFTAVSMYPKLWEATGLSYSRLLERLIELARDRHREMGRRLTSYAPEGG